MDSTPARSRTAAATDARRRAAQDALGRVRDAIRQIRRYRPLFNACDALLRRYGQVQKTLRPLPPATGEPAERAAAEREPIK